MLLKVLSKKHLKGQGAVGQVMQPMLVELTSEISRLEKEMVQKLQDLVILQNRKSRSAGREGPWTITWDWVPSRC